MKGFMWGLILLSFGGKLLEHFLPRGDKSPLFPPLRFLLSLCFIFLLFSPWIQWIKSDTKTIKGLDELFSSAIEIDGNQIILEQMGKTMKQSVKTAFPHYDFSLEIYTNEENVPVLVKVVGNDPVTGEKIAEFIEKNYNLESVAE